MNIKPTDPTSKSSYQQKYKRTFTNMRSMAIRTRPEVGKIMGISEARVHQLEQSALGKIYAALKPEEMKAWARRPSQ